MKQVKFYFVNIELPKKIKIKICSVFNRYDRNNRNTKNFMFFPHLYYAFCKYKQANRLTEKKNVLE